MTAAITNMEASGMPLQHHGISHVSTEPDMMWFKV